MIETEAPRTLAEREKAAEEAVKQIDKQHGDNTVIHLGGAVGKPYPHIACGIHGVDTTVLGIGGFPRGRVVEIFGPEAGGKTTLLLRLIAQAQRQKELCALVDAEHSLDPNWATKNGVNVDDLYVCQPDHGEQALEVAAALIRSQAFAVVGIDSVAALVPKAELDGEMGDSHMGLQARLMSQALRKLTGLVNKTGTILVFINQIREKIGVVYGSPETTTGGRALKFYASVRLDVRRIAGVKDGEEVIANKVRVKGAKNKLSAPFRETEVDLLFDYGFDDVGSLIDAAVEAKKVDKSGSWFNFNGERFQGKAAFRAALLDDKEMYKKLKESL